jgi:3-ketoacyl-CoA synthase
MRGIQLLEGKLSLSNQDLERSDRLSQKTYLPKAIMRATMNLCMAEARMEVEAVMFGAINELLTKTGVKGKDIGNVTHGRGSPNPPGLQFFY